MATLGVLVVGAPAHAATLTICNKAGEDIVDLHLRGGPKRSLALMKRGDCVAWSNIAPGSYYVGYFLGDSRGLLCALPIEFRGTMRVEISPTTAAHCIK